PLQVSVMVQPVNNRSTKGRKLMSSTFTRVPKLFGFMMLIAVSLAHSKQLSAKTLYMAKNGTDSNPCSQASPCATFAHVFPLLVAGDTLYVRGGNYAQTALGDGLSNSGTASSPITVHNFPGETVTILNIKFYVSANVEYWVF